MPAQLRLTLTDEEAEALDEARGAATRTAYATRLLRQTVSCIDGEDLETMIRRILREELARAAGSHAD